MNDKNDVLEYKIESCKAIMCDPITTYMNNVIEWFFRDSGKKNVDEMQERCRRLRNVFLKNTMGDPLHRPAVAVSLVYVAANGIKPVLKTTIPQYFKMKKWCWKCSDYYYTGFSMKCMLNKCKMPYKRGFWVIKKRKIIQNELAKFAGITEVTLRKYYKIISKSCKVNWHEYTILDDL